MTENSIKANIAALEAAIAYDFYRWPDEYFKRARVILASHARMRAALEEFDNFAWTAVTADCEEARVYLNWKIEKARAALADTITLDNANG